MNTTTRTLITIPLAAAALSVGTTVALAGPALADFPIAQPEPEPPGPEDGPGDIDGPAGDPGPDGPGDLDGPNPDDSDDSDDSDDGKKVRRPSRVDAGAADANEGGLSLTWLLASGAVVTAAGGFTARRAALQRR